MPPLRLAITVGIVPSLGPLFHSGGEVALSRVEIKIFSISAPLH